MILAILLGVILATGDAPPAIATAIIVTAVIARAVAEIAIPKGIVTGALRSLR